MKTRSKLGAILLSLSTAIPLQAGTLVELFTSQGCSSCPPADEFLKELAQDPENITIAFHVDYWDYLGYPDTFASPFFTQRQVAYASKRKSKQVFTPNTIVGGDLSYIGSDYAGIYDGIDQARERAKFTSTLTRNENGEYQIELTPEIAILGKYDLVVAYTLPPQSVAIDAGENKGRTITYTDVVEKIETLGKWDGESVISTKLKPKNGRNLVFFIQEAGLGPVIYATRIAN